MVAVPNRCSGPYSTREKASDAMVAGSSRACSRFGQPLLPLAFELFLRERRPERDVGHDRQRLGEPRHRHVQPDGRRIDAAGGVQVGAEEVDRVGESRAPIASRRLRSASRPSGWRRRTCPADRSPCRSNEQVHLRDRHLVQLDDPDRQAVGELPLLDRRQLEGRAPDRCAGGFDAVGRLRRSDRPPDSTSATIDAISTFIRLRFLRLRPA